MTLSEEESAADRQESSGSKESPHDFPTASAPPARAPAPACCVSGVPPIKSIQLRIQAIEEILTWKGKAAETLVTYSIIAPVTPRLLTPCPRVFQLRSPCKYSSVQHAHSNTHSQMLQCACLAHRTGSDGISTTTHSRAAFLISTAILALLLHPSRPGRSPGIPLVSLAARRFWPPIPTLSRHPAIWCLPYR